MPEAQQPHLDRRRAESFGSVAESYDRFRPRYPRALITGLVVRERLRVLDVGAGTGIASAQLRAAGADVLAVEPDPRMAEIAAGKGLPVEQAKFEDWEPRSRTFDLVVFAQSFHWVDPREALRKVATVLSPGGRLALLSNRFSPTAPPRQDLDDIYADFDMPHGPPIDATRRTELFALLDECGYSLEERAEVEDLHYTTGDWLGMVFTYSNHLGLEPESRALLRSRLETRIGTAGVTARNDALAIVCAPTDNQGR
ncbi:class I SAM-dependent methyltransferase [Nocardia flavorosea]|uniref:Class I SAM-dependent methyltransferase n=1 Tax=Nocardia flavorosea TaxID=53429 RepID=A0A846YLH5_9NOCA|nr:class I SAM-dependent methyltransferase [Nocardia flavorosea]NKY58460.1 class I SAM-dependent methyltransferase [Nocardia flavorosea]